MAKRASDLQPGRDGLEIAAAGFHAVDPAVPEFPQSTNRIVVFTEDDQVEQLVAGQLLGNSA
jgi:hypothetical protein